MMDVQVIEVCSIAVHDNSFGRSKKSHEALSKEHQVHVFVKIAASQADKVQQLGGADAAQDSLISSGKFIIIMLSI